MVELAVPWGALLLVAGAGMTVAAARRLAPRLLAGASSNSEAALRLVLIAVWLTTSIVAVLGLVGVLGPVAIFVVAALLYAGVRRWPVSSPQGNCGLDSWPRAILWPAILTLLLAVLDLIAQLPASPVDWDAATYHLYLPARWLQEGRIFHVPTVFGDNAAAFAPQNGALFFAWQMALSGRDAVINVSQLLCLGFLGLALYRICRLLDVDRAAAVLAALTLPWLAPIRRWTYSGNVDVFMVALGVGAVYWALLYRLRVQTSAIVACGLAAGLAAGTKTLGLSLAVLATLPAVWASLRHRRFVDVALFLGCALASGGWWYLVNLVRYGNPLFPVTLSFGPLELPGAYDASAIRAGEFHLDKAADVAIGVLANYGATTCLLLILGLSALAWRAVVDLQRRVVDEPFVLLFQALAWAVFFVFVVPHNDQARFLMPTLVIGLVGWALVLDRARRASSMTANLVWLAGILALAWASRPWQAWTANLAALDRADVAAGGWVLTAVLCGGVAVGGYFLSRRLGRRPAALTGWAMVWVVLTVGTLNADIARPVFFAGADYRGWVEGYLPFNDPARPSARIAYTGANVPYALAGAGWRHRVAYVDTQGEQGDGFYQHWRRDPRAFPRRGTGEKYDYHKPGLYRGSDDVERWLRHLEEEDIDTLVIFRLHRAESRYIRSTPEGFPIERAWVRQRPEHFAPLFVGRNAEIYSVTGPG